MPFQIGSIAFISFFLSQHPSTKYHICCLCDAPSAAYKFSSTFATMNKSLWDGRVQCATTSKCFTMYHIFEVSRETFHEKFYVVWLRDKLIQKRKKQLIPRIDHTHTYTRTFAELEQFANSIIYGWIHFRRRVIDVDKLLLFKSTAPLRT